MNNTCHPRLGGLLYLGAEVGRKYIIYLITVTVFSEHSYDYEKEGL